MFRDEETNEFYKQILLLTEQVDIRSYSNI